MSAPPNVVLVMTDQHRAGFTAGEGFELDTMPYVDGLARSGTRFRRAYTTAPACVPARTSLLTGRFPSTHRVRQNSAVHEVVRGDDLLDVLGRSGHSLHFAGKTHVYRGSAEHFDTFAGPYGHVHGPDRDEQQREFAAWMTAIDHGPTAEPTPFPLETQFPHRIVSDMIDALNRRDRNRPFFSWVSMPEPHNPYQAPEPYFSMFDEQEVPERACGPEAAEAKGGAWRWLRDVVEAKRPGYDDRWRRYRATYCGMLRLIDDQIRRLLDHLDAAGDLENTVVLVVADHGDYVGDYGLQRKGAGMPEALMRVPFVVRGPGVLARDDTTDFVSLVDVFPTVCEAVGAPIPTGVQGRSLWPLLTGEAYPEAEFDSVVAERGYGGLPYGADERPPLHFDYDGPTYDELNTVTQSGTSRMVRHGDWKLVWHVDGGRELYDVAADPMELCDRWDDPELADVRQQLMERMLSWSLRLADDLPAAAYESRRAPHNWVRT
ncbi:arylsulfatase A-like enzyme [Haloactinopolyspora alba]|uniref:Arylsulfatase A-like enzyme n=1 Tax=Haloactinopolyspora alba TaxID=648780 RepID=A0A2P8EBK1_9ACTN|nr:sulfatase-like hydrolase/transferase [Haloactinopolyspora alba]PSL06851.1 arylsulfatase A-like enzyme [Haloactinopolyspora alba]